MEVGGKWLTRALGVGRARAAAAPGRAEAALLRERCRAVPADPSLQTPLATSGAAEDVRAKEGDRLGGGGVARGVRRASVAVAGGAHRPRPAAAPVVAQLEEARLLPPDPIQEAVLGQTEVPGVRKHQRWRTRREATQPARAAACEELYADAQEGRGHEERCCPPEPECTVQERGGVERLLVGQ